MTEEEMEVIKALADGTIRRAVEDMNKGMLMALEEAYKKIAASGEIIGKAVVDGLSRLSGGVK